MLTLLSGFEFLILFLATDEMYIIGHFGCLVSIIRSGLSITTSVCLTA